MKTQFLLLVCILLIATTVSAQMPGGIIRIYADDQGNSCNITDGVPGVVSFYIFHEQCPGATAVELKLDISGFNYSTFFGDYSPFSLKMGTFYQGTSIAFGSCMNGTIFLGSANFAGSGTTSGCWRVNAVNHPVPSLAGATTPVMVDCSAQGQPVLVDGGAAIINATGECSCDDIYDGCPAVSSGTLLFAERLSTDASFIPQAPGERYYYATRYVEITRQPGEHIYLSGSYGGWTPLVADDDILINHQSVGPGPYNPVIMPPYPTGVPITAILESLKADEIPESVIPVGTACYRIDLVDTQREVFGNTNIYFYKTTEEPTVLTIACPDPVMVECPADVPPPDINSVTVTGTCPGDITVTHVSDISDGASCPEIITRTYQASDECGNQVTCVQTITIDDQTAPVLSGCPEDMQVQCLADVPSPANVTASDNCDASVPVTLTETDDGRNCPKTIIRTWRATDACGNSRSCAQTILVNDTTDPVLSGCPDDATYECMADVPEPANVTATDNCEGSITPLFTETDNGDNTPHIITRTWYASDGCNNMVLCVQTITVNDDQPPQITGCPDDIVLECGEQIPPPVTPIVVDNCTAEPDITLEETQSNPGEPCSNVITWTWTAFDEVGNSASCSQVITILGPPACSIEPPALDFGEVNTYSSSEASFVITNPGTSLLEGFVYEGCDLFSIVAGEGTFSLAPGDSRTVTVRFEPVEQGTFSCAISTGTYCDDVVATGIGVVAIAVALQSYQASWEGDHVAVTWELRGVTGPIGFEVARASDKGGRELLSAPDIRRSGDRFTLYDGDVTPGERYTYSVQVLEDGIATVSFETGVEIPSMSFALDAAHPNPFAETTAIGFTLPRAERVTLDVYDISGTRVATLVNRTMGTGPHTASWDGRDLEGRRVAAGIYFYRLRAGNETLTRKMVLLR